MKRTLFRDKLRRDWDDVFQMNTLQGILDFAERYKYSDYFYMQSEDGDDQDPTSMYSELARLQREGYIEVVWGPSKDPNWNGQRLQSITLTVAGHKLLAELREKSAAGRLKRRLSDLTWTTVVAIVSAVLTTLVTLYLKRE